ncbi:MAG: PD-(D/E)XK nuclease-like domain-containing protein [Muribaculaceae bacterium]|nr:PD-(D/E)XK nuclease-like domain-containing protein [Muribaculaceae bacterium]
MKNIIYNLSNEEYHNGEGYRDYISSTSLKHYLVSPRYYLFMRDNPQPPSAAQLLGTLFHDLMATLAIANGDWNKGYGEWKAGLAMFDPPVNTRTGKPYGADTKTYAEIYQAFLEANAGKVVVDTAVADIASDMAHSLLFDCGATSSQVLKLLKWGTPEVSVFHETEDGIKIKIRPDLLTPKKIVDWKSTNLTSLTEEAINRVILKYGYHISAAQYQWEMHEVTGRWYDFILVFMQTCPPFDAVMVDMRNYGYQYVESLETVVLGPGAIQFEELLKLHTRCRQANEYPGAETFIPGDRYRIMEIEPPRYYANRFMED